MGIINQWTVGLGVGAGLLGSQIISSSMDVDSSTPIQSAENNRIMLNSLSSGKRYFGMDEPGGSAMSFGAIAGVAGAVLGGALAFPISRKLSATPGIPWLSKMGEASAKAGKIDNDFTMLGFFGKTMGQLSPKGATRFMGVAGGGAAGAIAGGYVGASIYDYGVSHLTHNYLNSAKGSDVQGATAQRAPISLVDTTFAGIVSMGVFSVHRFGGDFIRSRMAKAGPDSFINKPAINRTLNAVTSNAASVGLAGAYAISTAMKMNAVNTNPNASKIEGLRY